MGTTTESQDHLKRSWRDVLRDENLRLRKKRGQNFLLHPEASKKIVRLLDLSENDVVLEVGPGLGALTTEITTQAKFVLAVEIEKAFCRVLKEWFGGSGRFEVLQGDILKIDLPRLFELMAEEVGPGGSVKILSNLPYYISTPVLSRMLENHKAFSCMVLTMQKEVAERITASPGNRRYGSLSVFAQYFCDIALEFTLPPGAFHPMPKVESAVVRFEPRESPPVLLLDEALFFELVRGAFTARRKTLRNSLGKAFTRKGLTQALATSLLERCNIDSRRRAETLSLSEFARLANMLTQWQGKAK